MEFNMLRHVSVLTFLMVSTTAVERHQTANIMMLKPKGGEIYITSNSTSHTYRFLFPSKYWDNELMANVVISVGRLSEGDNITLSGVGSVKTTSCYFLVQNVSADHRPLTNSCDVDETLAKKYGCEIVKNMKNLRITVHVTPSSTTKTLFYVKYDLRKCNENINENVSAMSTIKYTDSGVRNRAMDFGLPALQSQTTAGDSAVVTNCPGCDSNTLLISLTVSGTLVIIIVISVLLLCRRCRTNRSIRKMSTSSSAPPDTAISSIGSPMSSTLAFSQESISTDSTQQSRQLPHKHIFSPPVPRRIDQPLSSKATVVCERASKTDEQNLSHSPDGMLVGPLKSFKPSPPLVDRDRIRVNDEGVAYAISPLMKNQYHQSDSGFSGSLSQLLHSRPTREFVRDLPSQAPGRYESQTQRGVAINSAGFDEILTVVNSSRNKQTPMTDRAVAYDSPTYFVPQRNDALKAYSHVLPAKDRKYVNIMPRIDESKEKSRMQPYEHMTLRIKESPVKPTRSVYESRSHINQPMYDWPADMDDAAA